MGQENMTEGIQILFRHLSEALALLVEGIALVFAISAIGIVLGLIRRMGKAKR